MLPIQPPLIPAYFDFKKVQNIPTTIHKRFFLSWEDALWHLLAAHKIPDNSKILIPEFFCWDVVNNMRDHGLESVTYAVDKYLQPDEADFSKKLQTEKPAIVVIFHAVGITNPLLGSVGKLHSAQRSHNSKNWLRFLPQETLLIEDCVHRVIDPTKLTFITKNHYAIDSLRKVAPVQGSWVYSQQAIPKTATAQTVATNIRTSWYRLQVFFWWVVMQVCLIFVYYSKSEKMQKRGNRLAELAMKAGYDVIGDHDLPSCGIAGMAWLSGKLNTQKIYAVKAEQARLYKKLLQQTLRTNRTNRTNQHVFAIPFFDSDNSLLRGFPLGIELHIADVFLQHIREQGVLVRFELDDSIWSKKQKIIYLPMGLHVSVADITAVCGVIEGYGL